MAISQNYLPFFSTIMRYLKYIVFFILYVFAFYYLFINNTVPISFLLLLFLHFFIIGLIFSDSKYLHLQDFKFEDINYIPLYGFNTLFKYFIYWGPIICWFLLLISLSIIVYIIFRLKYYYNKGGDIFNLEENHGNQFYLFKIIIIFSYFIFAFLYGINLSGILHFYHKDKYTHTDTDTTTNGINLSYIVILLMTLLYFLSGTAIYFARKSNNFFTPFYS